MNLQRLIFLMLLALPLPGMAQRYEIGIFGGVANYVGDMAPTPIVSESNPAVGLILKRNFTDYFSMGIALNYGAISGDDRNLKNLSFRGLNFTSNIFEISPQLEFNFFRLTLGQSNFRYTAETVKFTPYIFTGISIFHFNPKGRSIFDDKVYELQPLSTEGQGVVKGAPDPYKLWQLAVPVGGGFKYNINSKFNLILSFGYRLTFTDYLDDVGGAYTDVELLQSKKGDAAAYLSDPLYPKNPRAAGMQRGISDTKDHYIFAGLTISYIIPGKMCYSFKKQGIL